MLCRVFAALVFLCLPFSLFSQIYADFTTSMGNFTCTLDYTNSPKAVANFIGLASGQRTWLDESKGVRTNLFYNGLTFHRVITNFMIQGGSPNGKGTDGPGYSFVDELTTSVFTTTGMLAMANSGPDVNGSQFFITVAPATWLNGIHTVFGKVTANYPVVDSISKVLTDANDAPLTPVVIQGVAIRRVGTAANAFNINGQGLPTLTNVPVKISNASPNVVLAFTNRLHSESRLLYSTNLTTWFNTSLGVQTISAVTQWLTETNVVPIMPKEFFRIAQAQYPSTRPAPASLRGLKIAFEFSGNNGTNTTSFDQFGGGTYTWPTFFGAQTKNLVQYNWKLDPFRGRLLPIYWDGFYPFNLHLSYSTPTNGTFSGTYLFNGAPASGVFRHK